MRLKSISNLAPVIKAKTASSVRKLNDRVLVHCADLVTFTDVYDADSFRLATAAGRQQSDKQDDPFHGITLPNLLVFEALRLLC